jgi:hypothetical protein
MDKKVYQNIPKEKAKGFAKTAIAKRRLVVDGGLFLIVITYCCAL